MSPKDTPIRITEQAYRQIIEFLGTHAPEHGGIIGADSNGTVMSFFPDVSGKSTKNGYTPDIRMLNAHIQTHWYPQQIHLVGIVHSHCSSSTPSCGNNDRFMSRRFDSIPKLSPRAERIPPTPVPVRFPPEVSQIFNASVCP